MYNSHGITPVKFIEDTVSGKPPWRERAIGTILEEAVTGDIIIAARSFGKRAITSIGLYHKL